MGKKDKKKRSVNVTTAWKARGLLGSNIFSAWRGSDNHKCQNEGDRKYHTISMKRKKAQKNQSEWD